MVAAATQREPLRTSQSNINVLNRKNDFPSTHSSKGPQLVRTIQDRILFFNSCVTPKSAPSPVIPPETLLFETLQSGLEACECPTFINAGERLFLIMGIDGKDLAGNSTDTADLRFDTVMYLSSSSFINDYLAHLGGPRHTILNAVPTRVSIEHSLPLQTAHAILFTLACNSPQDIAPNPLPTGRNDVILRALERGGVAGDLQSSFVRNGGNIRSLLNPDEPMEIQVRKDNKPRKDAATLSYTLLGSLKSKWMPPDDTIDR